MRRGFLGSIAALAAGAGAAWGQAPMPVAPAGEPPAAIGVAGDVMPASGGPVPTIMPPVTVGPQGDPLGLGPTATLGPPPGPMYPTPGPYGAPLFQPPPGMGAGGGYGQAPHWWVNAEYMLGFATPQQVTFPLLTTSSPNQNGVLGQPTTIALIPAKTYDYNVISGYRLGGGFYGDADRRFGFDISALDNAVSHFSQKVSTDMIGTNGAGSLGVPLLARPYIDATTGLPTSQVFISPDIAAGVNPNQSVRGAGFFKFSTQTSLWEISPSAIWNVFRSAPTRRLWLSLDLMVGYKFLDLDEKVEMHSSSNLSAIRVTPVFQQTGPFGVPVQIGTQIVPVVTPVNVAGVTIVTPATVNIADKFSVTNHFNGADFALRGQARWGMFSLTTTGRVAVGNMHETLRVRGVTSFVNNDLQQAGYAFGGLYANSTNIGNYSTDKFTVIPELNVSLGINVTRSLSLFVGYNFIYIDNVIRPGNQLNPVINPATIPFSATYGNATTTPAPAKLVQSDFWYHAVNFGFQFRY
jgi:hypothetical protein